MCATSLRRSSQSAGSAKTLIGEGDAPRALRGIADGPFARSASIWSTCRFVGNTSPASHLSTVACSRPSAAPRTSDEPPARPQAAASSIARHDPRVPTLHVLRVFCAPDGSHGNELGVFLDGAEVPAGARQAVARELGFAETVFVDDAERGEVRIFTPALELPFAGHPTVGTAVLLAELRAPEVVARGEVALVIEEEIGPVRCTARRGGAGPRASFALPRLPAEALPGEGWRVLMHNDAVVQGLGQAPWMRDVRPGA